MKIKKWKEISKKEILRGHIFKYSVREIASQVSDKKGPFDLIECYNWVNVVAITKDHRLVVVKQYRNGTDSITSEVPGGAIEAGEDPLVAAKRELLEESGYISTNWTKLGEVDVNPAFMNNKCFFYLATDCEDTGKQTLDPLEEIEIELLTEQQVSSALESGEISHSLVVLALSLFQLQN